MKTKVEGSAFLRFLLCWRPSFQALQEIGDSFGGIHSQKLFMIDMLSSSIDKLRLECSTWPCSPCTGHKNIIKYISWFSISVKNLSKQYSLIELNLHYIFRDKSKLIGSHSTALNAMHPKTAWHWAVNRAFVAHIFCKKTGVYKL